MNKEALIKKIADEVRDTALITRPKHTTDFYVAIGTNLAEATYSGRKQEYSVARFRKHMRIAAAYCLKAAGVDSDIILQERLRQDKIWGTDFDRKNTANDWHAYVGHYISKAIRGNTQEYEINMVKACGICQGAVLIVDLYGGPAMRHYDNLPGAGGHCEHCGQEEGAYHVCPTTTIVNNVFLDKPVDELSPIPSPSPQVVDYLDEFVAALRTQLVSDEKRWGDAWLCHCAEQNNYHVIRFVEYYLESEKSGNLLPWLKVAGGALICWIKENHPEILLKTECYEPKVTITLVPKD